MKANGRIPTHKKENKSFFRRLNVINCNLHYLYANSRWCGFSDFHILLWAASANHHGLPMAVIKVATLKY